MKTFFKDFFESLLKISLTALIASTILIYSGPAEFRPEFLRRNRQEQLAPEPVGIKQIPENLEFLLAELISYLAEVKDEVGADRAAIVRIGEIDDSYSMTMLAEHVSDGFLRLQPYFLNYPVEEEYTDFVEGLIAKEQMVIYTGDLEEGNRHRILLERGGAHYSLVTTITSEDYEHIYLLVLDFEDKASITAEIEQSARDYSVNIFRIVQGFFGF